MEIRSLFVRAPGWPLRVFNVEQVPTKEFLVNLLSSAYGIDPGEFWVDNRPGEATLSLRLRLYGGKGGFGSNLRAQGSKMSSKRRAGGYESCRDLSGRRIRTVNQTRLISEYIQRKPEMDRRKEALIREKMLKAIEAPNRKSIFSDTAYLRTVQETVDSIESAVYDALLSSEDEDEEEEEEEEKESKDNNSHSESEGASGKEKVLKCIKGELDLDSAGPSSPSFALVQ